jgi:hypothetical protein
MRAGIGFASHSGWAAAVVLGGPPTAPLVLANTRIEMWDPADPGSKQPYHAVEGRPVADATRDLARYAASAQAAARSGLDALLESLRARGYPGPVVGILESSGRKGASVAAIIASHALIHTADGDHFRDALAQAAAGRGLAVRRVPTRGLEAYAAARLGRPAPRLQDAVKELGRQAGRPWTADQKAAALLAWTLLE